MRGMFLGAILLIAGFVGEADAATRTPVRCAVSGVVTKVVCDRPVRTVASKAVKRSRCAVQDVVGRTRGVMIRSRSRFGSMVRGCCK